MWTFENPPLDYLEDNYGFKPDQEWLDSLRLGSLRLGGEDIEPSLGSASFVSPNGLIITSTRCVRDSVTATRPKDLLIINSGFVAAARQDELRLKARNNGWLTAAQLIKISNVTDEVNKDISSTDNEIQIKKKRDSNKLAILDAASKADPKLVPQLVSLYQGAVIQLYQYRVYKDIRLVVLPHVQTAHFGGDPDNFTYPRYSLDFAFLRAYEDGKPVDTSKNFFQWKPGGAKKDELVLVSGNPGTTKRLLTKAQMEFERDVKIAMRVDSLTNSLRQNRDPGGNAFSGKFDPENPSKHWSSVRTGILQQENDLKAARANLNSLGDAKLMSKKTAVEQAFVARVMADKNLAEKYGDLWNQLADVARQRQLYEVRARFHTAAHPLLAIAVDIVRLCDPNESDEHREQARKNLDDWKGGSIEPNYYYIIACIDHFDQARNWLPKDDPFFKKVLSGKSGKEFVDAIAPARRPSNWVGYSEPRETLIKEGWQAVQNSQDPAIAAARNLVPLIRAREKLGVELDAKEEALGIEIARALFECYGKQVSSDGTATLRFTDGVVKGYSSNGTFAPHRTTLDGLYDRSVEFAGKYPYNLPKNWLDRKDNINMTKPVNFVSTNDINAAAGSSGSVVVNKELEVVGVVVDGNIESLHNDFVFNDDKSRTVSTHVDGIIEALAKIYDAHHIAKELNGK